MKTNENRNTVRIAYVEQTRRPEIDEGMKKLLAYAKDSSLYANQVMQKAIQRKNELEYRIGDN